jgi:peroxiredoxin (alkyl hydroperoxide reductase subunit C)
MSLVTKQAPDFTAQAVANKSIKDNFKLSDFKGQYVILFFYPLDFTFVCPTEIHAFQNALPEFEKRGVNVIGVSIDSAYSHFAWVNTPKAQGGISGVTYPLVADITKQISRDYGVLLEDQGVALRGLFLIDKEGIVQHEVVNNLPLGRRVDEALRIVDALQFTEKYGEVCPANWNKESKGLKPNQEGLKEFFSD